MCLWRQINGLLWYIRMKSKSKTSLMNVSCVWSLLFVAYQGWQLCRSRVDWFIIIYDWHLQLYISTSSISTPLHLTHMCSAMNQCKGEMVCLIVENLWREIIYWQQGSHDPKCHLLTLPSEVRLHIHGALLSRQQPVEIRWSPKPLYCEWCWHMVALRTLCASLFTEIADDPTIDLGLA